MFVLNFSGFKFYYGCLGNFFNRGVFMFLIVRVLVECIFLYFMFVFLLFKDRVWGYVIFEW